MDSPRRRRAKTTRSPRNIPTRSRNIWGSRLLCTGTRFTVCRSIRCGSSTPMARACGRPGPMAPCSASFSSRSWREGRLRWSVTAASGAILSMRAMLPRPFCARPRRPSAERSGTSAAGNPQSVNRLVELIGGPVIYIPKRPGEPEVTWADIGKIARELGWRPRLSFEEGVSLMMAEIDSWRDAPLWDAASIADATRPWFRHLGSGSLSMTELSEAFRHKIKTVDELCAGDWSPPASSAPWSCATACSTSCTPAISGICSMPRARPTSWSRA